MRIDAKVLGQIFGLETEHATTVGTLSGLPYILLVCKAPVGYQDGDHIVGTIKQNPNGSVVLGYTKA